MKRKIVFLDPGHGGHDPGALGPSGLKESNMALDVCLRARDLLLPYCDVLLTREKDTFVSLSGRAKLANEGGADAFISYHFNSATSASVGLSFEGFTTRGQNNSDRLCEAILRNHGELLPEQVLRADRSDGDIDKEANFAVIRKTACPSCLIEGEFIHTNHGAHLIMNPLKRQAMAEAVKLGVLEFFGISSAGLTDADVMAIVERIESSCADLREAVKGV